MDNDDDGGQDKRKQTTTLTVSKPNNMSVVAAISENLANKVKDRLLQASSSLIKAPSLIGLSSLKK